LEDKIRKSKVETKCIIEMYRNNQMMMMGLQKKGEGTTSSGECWGIVSIALTTK